MNRPEICNPTGASVQADVFIDIFEKVRQSRIQVLAIPHSSTSPFLHHSNIPFFRFSISRSFHHFEAIVKYRICGLLRL
jgi:hypothetical protein